MARLATATEVVVEIEQELVTLEQELVGRSEEIGRLLAKVKLLQGENGVLHATIKKKRAAVLVAKEEVKLATVKSELQKLKKESSSSSSDSDDDSSEAEIQTEVRPDPLPVKAEVLPDGSDGDGGGTGVSVAESVHADVAMDGGGGTALCDVARKRRGRPASNLPKTEKGPKGRKRLNHTGQTHYAWVKAGRP